MSKIIYDKDLIIDLLTDNLEWLNANMTSSSVASESRKTIESIWEIVQSDNNSMEGNIANLIAKVDISVGAKPIGMTDDEIVQLIENS